MSKNVAIKINSLYKKVFNWTFQLYKNFITSSRFFLFFLFASHIYLHAERCMIVSTKVHLLNFICTYFCTSLSAGKVPMLSISLNYYDTPILCRTNAFFLSWTCPRCAEFACRSLNLYFSRLCRTFTISAEIAESVALVSMGNVRFNLYFRSAF